MEDWVAQPISVSDTGLYLTPPPPIIFIVLLLDHVRPDKRF